MIPVPISMFESLIVYSLCLFSAFYVLNHSEILDKARAAASKLVPDWMQYSFSCAFCFSFWTSLALGYFYGIEWFYAAASPPIVMFFNLTYLRLLPPSTPTPPSSNP